MIRRNFRLTPAEDASIAVILAEAEVKEAGILAAFPRKKFNPHTGREVERKYSPIEILWRAQQRASDRAMREQERNGWH